MKANYISHAEDVGWPPKKAVKNLLNGNTKKPGKIESIASHPAYAYAGADVELLADGTNG